MIDYKQLSLEKHAQYKGKLTTESKVPLQNKDDLSTYYSPGVAAPCLAIADDPEQAYVHTWKQNTIAVVSDGTAVLGLGNIGGLAGLPVMEGKAILFKGFGGVDAVPIVLDTQDPDEIIETVVRIAPTFGGINLEDIKAPQCFYIEEELQKRLNIPVFHDDQHGTAIVTLAGLINASKLVGKPLSEMRIVVSGAGAAAIACIKLMRAYGVRDIVTFDSRGAIYPEREGLNAYKKDIADLNVRDVRGSLGDAMIGTDVFVGLSGQANSVTSEMVTQMADKPVIFATSNPDPEIHPDEAKKGGAYIVSTGRSDFPNQVNNVLAFPGIFRGLLDARIPNVTDDHKIAAAEAIASCVGDGELGPDMIIPSPFDPQVVSVVAEAVKQIG